MTKGKERTVRHVQVLGNVLGLERAGMVRIGKLLRAPGGELAIVERLLAYGTRKAHGQFPARRDRAEQGLDQSRPRFHTGEPDFRKGGNVRSGPLEYQRPPRKNKKDDRFSCGDDGLQQILLIAGKIQARARSSLPAHGARFVAIPGMGPVTATALVAAMGNGTAFTKGREFAAWLGLVPREHTTGGKQKLLGIRKRGNSYLRKLFVHGARAVMRFRAPQTSGLRAWLEPLTARTHHQVAIVALANKLARMAWAVLAKNERYRPPVVARLDTAAGGCGAKLVSQI